MLSKLAWPLLIAQVTQTLMGVSDTIMAGRFNSLDMAAVAVGVGLCLPIMIFIQGLSWALSPVVSRLHGEKNASAVPHQVYQMMYITLIASALALCLLLAMPWAINLVDMDSDLAALTYDYTRFIFYSFPALAIYQTLRNYCEGLSLTLPTMVIMITGLIINIPANYIFINGHFGMPQLGGAGCGLATMLVTIAMAFSTFLYALLSKRLKLYYLFNKLSAPDLTQMWVLVKMGIPIAFTLLFEVSLFACVALLLAPFGAQTVASHQITLNVSSLIFMLPLSIGIAVAIRIGYLIGEGRTSQSLNAYWSGMFLAGTTVIFTSSILILFNEEIASLYSKEETVISAAASLLLLAVLFQVSDAIQVVSANALRGYKDTTAMFVISFCSYWLVGFPVGIVLGLSDLVVPKMAAAGFWIGFISGLSVAAVLMFLRVRYIQRKILTTG